MDDDEVFAWLQDVTLQVDEAVEMVMQGVGVISSKSLSGSRDIILRSVGAAHHLALAIEELQAIQDQIKP